MIKPAPKWYCCCSPVLHSDFVYIDIFTDNWCCRFYPRFYAMMHPQNKRFDIESVDHNLSYVVLSFPFKRLDKKCVEAKISCSTLHCSLIKRTPEETSTDRWRSIKKCAVSATQNTLRAWNCLSMAQQHLSCGDRKGRLLVNLYIPVEIMKPSNV